MKGRMLLGVSICLVLLAVGVGYSLAQAPESATEPAAAAPMNDVIPIQGRLTDAGGNPVNGDLSITFRLYDVASGGTALCSDIDTVNVSAGLFKAEMDTCTAAVLDGRQLYLGLQISGEAEMTPRQAIYAAPYAWGLRPGAIISNTATSGHGLSVWSKANGSGGTALRAENVGTGGIGIWGVANGTDAAIIASNRGSGMLFKGFGGDGGEDEFRVNNNGSIESKADSYVFISGSNFIKDDSTDTTRWTVRDNGSVEIYSGGSGTKLIQVPITLPGVLYGQPVKVESVTFYYQCADGTKGYIDQVWLFKQNGVDDTVTVATDATDRTSNAAATFTLTPTSNNVLSADQGILSIAIRLQFADNVHYVRYGGVRLQLHHHDLY